MKRLLWAIGGLLVLLVAGVLIGPGLIDWNQYKGDIAAQAKSLTGRELVINGNIEIAVFPAPALIAGDVTLTNIKGASSPWMMRLKSLEVRIALGPLLGGRVEVERIKLVDPVIQLEVLDDGRRNWVFDGPDGTARAAPEGGSPEGARPAEGDPPAEISTPPISLESFTIENGTLIYRDAKSGVFERIEDINANISAASLAGPFESTGGLRARGVALGYEVNVGRIIGGRTVPFNLKLAMVGRDARLRMSGTVVNLANAPKIKGKVTGKGASLAGLIAALAPGTAPPAILSQPFSFEGAVTAAAGGGAVKGLSVKLGNTQATVDVTVTWEKTLNVAARVAASRIDLDEWLKLAAGPAPAADKTKDGAAGTASPSKAPAPAPRDAGGTAAPFALPMGVNASLVFSAEAITFRRGVIREAKLNVELANGEVTISQLSGQFPGGSDIAVFGFVTVAKGEPRFEGEVETTVNDLRGVLRWLGTDIDGVSPDRLRKMTLATRVVAGPKQVQLTGLDLQFDASRLTGGVTVAVSKRPSFGADFTLDRLNLDAYLPAALRKKTGTKAKSGAAEAKKPENARGTKDARTAKEDPFSALRALTGLDANLKMRVKSLVFQGNRIKDVLFDGTLYNGKLEIRRLSVAKMAGASASVSGVLDLAGEVPVAKGVKFKVRVGDLPRFLRLAGLDPPAAARKLGSVTLSGRIDGTLRAPSFDVSIEGAGAKATLAGRLDGLDGIPVAKGLQFGIETKDVSRLLRLAGMEPPKVAKRLGKVTLKGMLDGNLLRSNLTLTLEAAGAKVGLTGVLGGMLLGDAIDMTLEASHPNFEKLLRTLAGYRPVGKKMGGFKLTARLKGGVEALSLSGIDAKIGTVKVKGDVTLALGGARPKLTAKLASGAIVIDPFLPAPRSASLPGRPTGRARIIPAAWPGAAVPPMDAAAPWLNLAAAAPWPRDAIDFSALTGLDAEVTLTSPSVRFQEFNLEDANLTAKLENGKLNAEIAKSRVFGGELKARVTVAAARRPLIGVNFTLANIDVRQAARAITGQDRATGRFDLKADLKTAGGSIADMVGGLSGGGAMNARKLTYRMKGIKIPVNANVSGPFTVRGGSVRFESIRIATNLGDGGAKGTIDLARWNARIDGVIRPLKNAMSNFLSAANLALAITGKTAQPPDVPFWVRGPLDDLDVGYDHKVLLNWVRSMSIGKLFKKAPKGIGGILEGLLGGALGQGTGTTGGDTRTPPPPGSEPPPPGSEPPPPPAEPEQQPRKFRPVDILKQLFRR